MNNEKEIKPSERIFNIFDELETIKAYQGATKEILYIRSIMKYLDEQHAKKYEECEHEWHVDFYSSNCIKCGLEINDYKPSPSNEPVKECDHVWAGTLLGKHNVCCKCGIDNPLHTRIFSVNEPIETNNIVFQTNMEILKLCKNGDIFVKGKLIENDKQVVDGLREFLNYHEELKEKNV